MAVSASQMLSAVTKIIYDLGQDATFTRTMKTDASATPAITTVGSARAVFGKILKSLVNVPTPNNSAVTADNRTIYLAGTPSYIPSVNDKCTIGNQSWIVTSSQPYMLQATTIAIKVTMR